MRRRSDRVHSRKPVSRYLGHLDLLVVVYGAVGKYDEDAFRDWFHRQGSQELSIFVGAASRQAAVTTSLSRAQSCGLLPLPAA